MKNARSRIMDNCPIIKFFKTIWRTIKRNIVNAIMEDETIDESEFQASIILIDPDNTIVNKVNFIKESTSIYFLAKLSKTTSSEWNTSSGHYKLECWHISGDSKELKFTWYTNKLDPDTSPLMSSFDEIEKGKYHYLVGL